MSNLIKVVLCCLAITAISYTAFATEDQLSEDTMSDEIQATTNEEQPSEDAMSDEIQATTNEEQPSEGSMSEEIQAQAPDSGSTE